MTHRIDKSEIEGLPVLAEGYKIFDDEWSCQGYCYADDQGEVEGSIHKIEGKLKICKNGLHFCEKMIDCFKHYAPVQWNKFAKVRAYGEKETQDEKTACTILEIVRVLSWGEMWDEMIEECKKHTTDISGGTDIWGGNYIRGGNNIWGGTDIRGGNYIRGGNNIWGGTDIWGGNNIRGGNNIWGGTDIWGGNNIRGGNYISGGTDIWGGNNISGGNYISGGNNIWGGTDISGGNYISGGSRIWYSEKLAGAYACVLCFGLNGVKYRIFNKKVTKARLEAVADKLLGFNWCPCFTNAWDLKEDKKWEETPAPKIAEKTPKEAYAEMPKDLLNYIRNMPEYDEEIFNKITHGAFEEGEQ